MKIDTLSMPIHVKFFFFCERAEAKIFSCQTHFPSIEFHDLELERNAFMLWNSVLRTLSSYSLLAKIQPPHLSRINCLTPKCQGFPYQNNLLQTSHISITHLSGQQALSIIFTCEKKTQFCMMCVWLLANAKHYCIIYYSFDIQAIFSMAYVSMIILVVILFLQYFTLSLIVNYF